MNLRKQLLILALGLFAPLLMAAERPNVIIMVADDLGWSDVGFHGGDIDTPSPSLLWWRMTWAGVMWAFTAAISIHRRWTGWRRRAWSFPGSTPRPSVLPPGQH
jgi:hypothetical protein